MQGRLCFCASKPKLGKTGDIRRITFASPGICTSASRRLRDVASCSPHKSGGPHMSSEDISYYRQRAETERANAEASERANVAAIHAELAGLYDALVEHKVLRPKFRPVLRIATRENA